MSEMPAGLSVAEVRALSADKQVDLLVGLERQRRRLEAAQLRLLAVMQARDDSELNLMQEEVSLTLRVPVRTAQLRLACRRHNQAKATGTGWSYQHNPDGSFTWTTATGHHYTNPASRPWRDPAPPES